MDSLRKIIIIGGTGFIGKHLTSKLINEGYSPIVISRMKIEDSKNIRFLSWDGKSLLHLKEEFQGTSAIINLAGKNINCRWTTANKKQILNSRINVLKAIYELLPYIKNQLVWIQTSAVGFYGNTGDKICDESTPGGDSFLAYVCKEMEKRIEQFQQNNVRIVVPRIGGVLGNEGGMLPILSSLTKYFLGSAIGNGNQYISCIHSEDLTSIFFQMIQNSNLNGVVNCTAPFPVKNKELMQNLRKQIGRPWIPPVPSPVFKLTSKIIGIPDELVIDGQKAIPNKLLKNNFKFKFPELKTALNNLIPNT